MTNRFTLVTEITDDNQFNVQHTARGRFFYRIDFSAWTVEIEYRERSQWEETTEAEARGQAVSGKLPARVDALQLKDYLENVDITDLVNNYSPQEGGFYGWGAAKKVEILNAIDEMEVQ